MSLKKRLYLLGLLLPLLLLNACLFGDNDDEIIEYDYTDAEIVSFSLSYDSIPELKNTLFTIDQYQSRIYNHDSLAYGTEIKKKVMVTYSSGSGINNLLVVGAEDSTWIASGDSIDVSLPVNLRAYALDGLTTKNYTLQINTHTVDPDSIQYKQVVSGLGFIHSINHRSIYFNSTFYYYVKNDTGVELYSSQNAANWSKEELSGLPNDVVVKNIIHHNKHGICARTESGDLYVSHDAVSWTKVGDEFPVVCILGYIEKSSLQEAGLCTVVNKDGTPVFAFSSDLLEWKYGNAVPEEFPLSGFSSLNQEIATLQQLSIVGGQTAEKKLVNSFWATQNGLYWAKITDERYSGLPYITDGNAFIYDNRICLINGKLDGDVLNSEFYASDDNGYTWVKQSEKYKLDSRFTLRSDASVVVDNEGTYFYILGGHRTDVWSEVWRGFLNKKLFDH